MASLTPTRPSAGARAFDAARSPSGSAYGSLRGSPRLSRPSLSPSSSRGSEPLLVPLHAHDVLPSRTLVVLLRSAGKVHRLQILARARAAGLAVLAERAERWHAQDADFLDAFLAAETAEARATWSRRMTAGELRVVVFEGAHAAQVWQHLLGCDRELDSRDACREEEEQRRETLRRTYGDAALYGSIDGEAAERQIAICFPELARPGELEKIAAEARDDHFDVAEQDTHAELRALSSAHLRKASAERDNDSCPIFSQVPIDVPDLDSAAPSRMPSHANLRSDGMQYAVDSESVEVLLSSPPRRHHAPSSPRAPSDVTTCSVTSSHSAELEVPIRRRSSALAKSDTSSTSSAFRARPLPSSTHAPMRQPRLSRAAALRMGVELPAAPVRTTSEDRLSTSSSGELGISGLARAEVAPPRSIAAPSMAPRMNRAAAIRAGLDVPAAAPRPRRSSAVPATPNDPSIGISGLRRAEVEAPASIAKPTLAPRMNRAAAIRAGVELPPSAAARRAAAAAMADKTEPQADVGISGLKRAEPTKVKALQAPSVAPRGNRASMARAAAPLLEATAPASPAKQRTHSRASASLSFPARSTSRAEGILAPRRDNVTPQPNEEAEAPAKVRREVDFSSTPGHRRKSLSISGLKSLAPPAIAPRSNTAAQRRLSIGSASAVAVAAPSKRPESAAAARRPGSALAKTTQPNRPTSALAQPHQDEPSRPARVRGTAPPSAYRHVF